MKTALFLILALPSFALAKPAICKLTIDGRTYIKGACEFTSLGADGSFLIQKGDYFAQVNVDGRGTGEAWWNEEPGASHAHTPLGRLTRNDACWVNRRVIVCAE